MDKYTSQPPLDEGIQVNIFLILIKNTTQKNTCMEHVSHQNWQIHSDNSHEMPHFC